MFRGDISFWESNSKMYEIHFRWGACYCFELVLALKKKKGK